MATIINELYHFLFGRERVPVEIRKILKPHYDAIHKCEKEIKKHNREIELIREKYGIQSIGKPIKNN